MRKLNLPFRKLSGCNLLEFYFALLVVAVAACTTRVSTQGETVEAKTSNAVNKLPLISLSDSVKESWFEIRSKNGGSSSAAVRVSAKSCIERKFVFGTTLSVLGQNFEVAFEEDAGQLSLAMIEDSETKLSGQFISPEIKEQICSTSRSPNTEAIVVTDDQLRALQEVLKQALVKITPDCREIDFQNRFAVCKLETLMPQAALVRTEEFQKAMIRKWSRQPYILARRTGVVSTLARAATNITNDEAFLKFCKVLQFSLPEELPVVMTSRRWQVALCSGDSQSRREAAFYGLAKGAQELDMLRELYEGTSRVGVLSVKIPGDSIPGPFGSISRQPLRVVISPDDQVSQKLVDQAKKYLGRSDHDSRPRKFLKYRRGSRNRRQVEIVRAKKEVVAESAATSSEMCWHPVFGETSGLLRIADGMKLTGKGFNLECGYIDTRNESAEVDVATLSKYLLQSLSSETEFVLDNGQSKLLRLPEGNYRYTVQVLPENPLDSEGVDEESVPKTSGDLNWDTTKRHLIRSW